MQPNFVTLQSGVKAFWVGDPKTAKYICVYYHGAWHPWYWHMH
jgi:hypothetical protein